MKEVLAAWPVVSPRAAPALPSPADFAGLFTNH
jgi:hypothetical protein